MIRLPKSVSIHCMLFIVSLVLLGTAFYFEYVKGLEPCPLCLSQRLVIAIIGIVSLLTLLVKPKARGLRMSGSILLIISAIGISLSSRQLYLESLPVSTHTVCVPGINYLLQVLPWQELLKSMFIGGPECGSVTWHFLGLSMAGWLLVVFIITLIIGLLEALKKTPHL